jgi:preprotein translocase subunit SecG
LRSKRLKDAARKAPSDRRRQLRVLGRQGVPILITVLTVIHILVTIAMVGVILIQRSEGGGLGIGGGGGGGGGMSGFMTGRGAANVLTRATAVLAGLFIVSSLALTLLATGGRERSIMDAPTQAPVSAPAAPQAPANTAPSAPVK